MVKTNDFMYKLKNVLIGIACFIVPIIGIVRISKRRNVSIGAKVAYSIMFCVLWIYALSLMYFTFWTFYNSLKTYDEFMTSYMAFPAEWSFYNYGQAYRSIEYSNVGFIGMFINSTWFAGGMSFLSIFFHAVTGYIFAKYTFPCKETAFKIIIFTLALPIVGSLPSMYKVVYGLGIENSPLYLISAMGGFGSNFLIMYSYFKGIDKTYMEAADIDGASRFNIFFKIMLPLAFAPCFSLFLLSFITQWNNYETPILFLDSMPTLSSGLYQFGELMRFYSDNPEPTYFAGALLASIPVVVLVAVFGDKIMSNVSMGGIKG